MTHHSTTNYSLISIILLLVAVLTVSFVLASTAKNMNFPKDTVRYLDEEEPGYFFQNRPQHPPPPEKNLEIPPNALSNLPKDTEISSLEKARDFTKWLKSITVALEDDVHMIIEHSPADKQNPNTIEEDKELKIKMANFSSSPCEPNFGSFVNVRFHPKRLIEPEEMFAVLPTSLCVDWKIICGELDPTKNATEFCSAAQWMLRDRRNRFFSNYTETYYDSDHKAPIHDQRMMIALFLSYVKFTDEETREEMLKPDSKNSMKHIFFTLPYVETFRNQPDVPLCSFTPGDLEFFPLKDQLMSERLEIWEFYDYLITRALPRFPKLFGKNKKEIEKTLTYDRFAWAYCQVMMRIRSVPATGKPGLVAPIDLMPNKRTLTNPNPSYSEPLQLIGLKSENYMDKGEEIYFSNFDRQTNYPLQFLERNTMETDESLACAVIELPWNKTHDPLYNDCFHEIMRMFEAVGFSYSRYDLNNVKFACIRPSVVKAMVKKMEQLNVYNKSACTVDKMHRDHFQKRTPRTKFLAAQHLSLVIRGQLKRFSAKLGRMEALMRKRREGEFETDEEREKMESAPHFDRIYEYTIHQKKLLNRIQTQLSTMMKESKPEYEVWQKTLDAKKREKEEAELIRKGLKKLDEEDDDDDDEDDGDE